MGMGQTKSSGKIAPCPEKVFIIGELGSYLINKLLAAVSVEKFFNK
jgi:hypothetical protein